jgi:M6 family metalloprotease-like protein
VKIRRDGNTGFGRASRIAVLLLLALTCAAGLEARAGDPVRFSCVPGTLAALGAPRAGSPGGRHLPSRGTLRVLLVFASFFDDETPHPYWPAHKPPLAMQQFIDPDVATRSAGAFNLTNYFRQMSLGAFQLIGDAVWVESAHSQEEYRNGAYGRANTDVLIEKVDPLVDFSAYDHWKNSGDYLNVNVADSLVDLIIMVWRTDMYESVGSATLGFPWNAGFILDGKKIELGFPERVDAPLGSGVTCEYLYGDDPVRAMRTMVHEVGHWLLGGAHPYSADPFIGGKHAYWGMLCNGERASSCANAYERGQLGWIPLPELPAGSARQLRDFVTTGDAAWCHPPGGEADETFLLENHQRLSVFDDATVNTSDRGLWILHQQGPYMELDNLRIVPSDGRWEWPSTGLTSACFSQQLPLFIRGLPVPGTGASHRDQLPSATSTLNWMFAFREKGAPPSCGAFFAGEGFEGSFHSGGSVVFSPFSNPESRPWSNGPATVCLEVTGDSAGVVAVRSHADPVEAPPARRYLGTDPARARGKDTVAVAWGTQWAGGQLLESDVVASELERQVGPGGKRDTVYRGPATSWVDAGLHYDSLAAIPVSFRVRVKDAQGKYSAWSVPYITAVGSVDHVGTDRGESGTKPRTIVLEQNYPNPFNPTTSVEFRTQNSEFIVLKVYDSLGREVAVLVNEVKRPGTYTVFFDGTRLASGVYYCRMIAGGRVETRTMMLLK